MKTLVAIALPCGVLALGFLVSAGRDIVREQRRRRREQRRMAAEWNRKTEAMRRRLGVAEPHSTERGDA